ncbi:cupin domain-containing protein [Xanthobacter dioxanivorans]|uniref:Cupin domain-containing protein n=1 Tax=Xanthobacter dioxanivorans TaxID=2528964 RepID=A0A974PUB8_9HYPH|nr:cupin domain-containing protein [Xanthobacter dioxanivorans]QRG09230.1 cupin domain-containing protein [Xanthobacter dioxanivorans]
MSEKGDVFAFADATPVEVIDEVVSRQILTFNDEIMMVRVIFKTPGPGGAPHSHPHVQITSVESGVFDLTIDGRTQRLKAGDSFYVPSGVHHGAICIEPGVLVDVFAPMRADFLKDA